MEYGLGDVLFFAVYFLSGLVLILIVVEYGLGVLEINVPKLNELVLILIVVEYGLGVLSKPKLRQVKLSLNPYCSGIWSRRFTS